ncbi:MAG: TatD family hydrolase [Flavobacteriales bacterium]
MEWIDTHAHLYLPQFDEDRDAVLDDAASKGVHRIYLPNIDLESIGPMHAMCDAWPAQCFPMMGLHPCSVQEGYEQVLGEMRAWFNKRAYAAVGEIGIDLYWDKSTLAIQQEAFRIQIGWAKELGLPIVIHARESFDEIFEIVDELNDERLTGIFHCFTGTREQAEHIIDYGGFKLGIGGVLTFKKSGLDATLTDVPLEHMVLETDAPYLAPTPFRGKRNETPYVLQVAERLAQVQDVPLEEVARVTSAGARELFAL